MCRSEETEAGKHLDAGERSQNLWPSHAQAENAASFCWNHLVPMCLQLTLGGGVRRWPDHLVVVLVTLMSLPSFKDLRLYL